MDSMLASPLCYLVPGLALVAAGTPLSRWLVPSVQFALLATGALINLDRSGWQAAALSLAAAGGLLLALVLTGLLSRTATFLIPISLAGLPLHAWAAVVPGFLLAGLVSAVIVRRSAGSGYLSVVVHETLDAAGLLGVTLGTGQVSKPDPARLPTPTEDSVSSDGPVGRAHRQRVRLCAYLGASVLGTGLLSLVLSLH